ncbi:YchJ family protein [Shewanella youngdeokensis]|uniref:YchJ family metal-binding protein n=1 Tax=Shewanella youngdeokensis TaxID=2999068 RepID=A0ABZ0K477_9GAMM|nr:YchJ family metal-binding protein [Shewanella sp. DAU334]
MTRNLNDPNHPCPCCSTKLFKDCCQPLHLGEIFAQSPAQLMRSRFSAFYMENYEYLISTHHVDYLCGLTEQTLRDSPSPQWLTLEVLSESESKNQGHVCFQAWFRADGELDAIHECSDFIKQGGQWYYTEGKQKAAVFPKRNEPCVCGSNKKFKQCCLA